MATITGDLEALPTEDAASLCERIAAEFVHPTDGLSWSSRSIKTAFLAINCVTKGPPEPLLQALWQRIEPEPFSGQMFQFCRRVGTHLQYHYLEEQWDLSWMAQSSSHSQAALRYFVMRLRSDIWEAGVEAEIEALISKMGF